MSSTSFSALAEAWLLSIRRQLLSRQAMNFSSPEWEYRHGVDKSGERICLPERGRRAVPLPHTGLGHAVWSNTLDRRLVWRGVDDAAIGRTVLQGSVGGSGIQAATGVGPWTDVVDPLSNQYFDFPTENWISVSLGPMTVGAVPNLYQLPSNPGAIPWAFPDLIVQLDTTILPTGPATLRVIGYTAAAVPGIVGDGTLAILALLLR